MNYWWGMDSNAIDVFYSHKLDVGTRRLADLLRHQLRDGAMKPFSETILSQDGTLRCTPGSTLTPAEIISMDWLADNIIGSFPEPEELTEPARRLVSFQGIEQYRER